MSARAALAPAPPVGLAIDGLSVAGPEGVLVRDVSLAAGPGRPLTLVGESGSGKSLVAAAVVGALPPGLRASGGVRLDGEDLLALTPAARRRLWGRRIALLPQEPWSALDPTMRIGAQVAEVHAHLHGRGRGAARAAARDDLARVALGGAGRLHPFALSGGMCQRAALAMAHAADAPVLIADEPTKGLDPALVAEVVERLRAEVAAGRVLVTITHDLAVARALGGSLGVMREGRLLEHGPAERVLDAPAHPYTRALVEADPRRWPPRAARTPGAVVIEGRGLAKARGGRRLFAEIDLTLHAGEVVAVVGPSGSGKTTLGDVLLGLTPPDVGTVTRGPGLARTRFQKLYQDPPAAFAPHLTLGQGLDDLARRHRLDPARTRALLDRLNLAPDLLARRPEAVSGGELQRLALARALLLDPVFLFADEFTSRLDAASQRAVIDLLMDVVARDGLAVLLVTHDAALAANLATRTIRVPGP